MVVRVNLNTVVLRDRRDDLVGVHVGGGTGTSLEHVDGELGIMFSVGNFLGGGNDGIALFGIQQAAVC